MRGLIIPAEYHEFYVGSDEITDETKLADVEHARLKLQCMQMQLPAMKEQLQVHNDRASTST